MQKYNISGSDRLYYLVVYLLIALAFIVTLYPFMYITSASLSNSHAIYRGDVYLYPVGFTLKGYAQVIKQTGLWIAYGNTIFYTVVGTLFNIFATMLAAYPLSRRKFFARKFLNFFTAFTMYFSGGLIPTYLLITGLGLYNSRWVMILPSLVSTYNLMVCRSAFSAIPEELIESAEIDGANDLKMFFAIAIRLITPTIAVLTLYYAVGHWNSYLPALLYLSKESLIPVQVILRRVLIQASNEFLNSGIDTNEIEATSIQIRYVTIIITTLPVLTVYPLIQKYFVKGVMLGAVKG